VVLAAVAAAVERFGRLDALVNNAGILVLGAIEDLTDEEITLGMETNLGAHIRTAPAVLPHTRAQGGGKIVNVGSSAGKVTGAAGRALLGLETRSRGDHGGVVLQVARWGVQVILVQPGEFKTRFHNKNRILRQTLKDDTSLYQEPAMAGAQNMIDRAGTRPGPRTLASTVADIIELEQPLPIRWPVGYDTHRTLPLRERLTDAQWEELRLRATSTPSSAAGIFERSGRRFALGGTATSGLGAG